MLKARFKKHLGRANSRALTIDVDLKAAQGITVLFGASGAGKTTILRAIAGILAPDEGRIVVGDEVYFDSAAGIVIPMQKRKVGYVFQNHVLFPHMTAEQNVLYGIRTGVRRNPRERARELLLMLGIEKTADRLPHQLSGGEQQRVALARALATDPSVMLLDEPLSAVDVSTRSRLLEEIVSIQRRSRIPFLYVTHNHSEALRLGDSMMVIEKGRVCQEGSPMEIFNAPRTASIAKVVGTENMFVGRILQHQFEDGTTIVGVDSCRIAAPLNALPVDSRVTIGIRSDDILVSLERLTQISARNVLEGVIKNIFIDVDKTELMVSCGIDLKVSVTRSAVRQLNLKIGSTVFLLIKARSVHLLE